MKAMTEVALVRGDGIGPEITEATVAVVEASGAAVRWIETPVGQGAERALGSALPGASLSEIRRVGVALKAPLIAERRSGGVVVEDAAGVRRHPSVNNGLRRELATYANLRPVRGWEGVSGAHRDFDVLIVRETTEDMYAGLEREVEPGVAEATKRITRRASERIARFACERARRSGRRKITAVHKANVLHLTDGLFLETVREVVAAERGLEFDDKMVDAAAYLMIKQPKAFDVMVLPNQYGDILSDVAAGLVGSMGLAPGANIGTDVAFFEAAHGAAPDIAGRGVANPLGLVLSGALMLDHVNQAEAARRIERAVASVLARGRSLTPDLGGRATTRELTQALCAAIGDGR